MCQRAVALPYGCGCTPLASFPPATSNADNLCCPLQPVPGWRRHQVALGGGLQAHHRGVGRAQPKRLPHSYDLVSAVGGCGCHLSPPFKKTPMRSRLLACSEYRQAGVPPFSPPPVRPPGTSPAVAGGAASLPRIPGCCKRCPCPARPGRFTSCCHGGRKTGECDIAQAAYAAGHELATHTMTHPDKQ